MENLNWNLGLIYKDRNEWTNDLEKINNMINELAAYKDKLNDKASFKEFLIKKTNAELILSKAFCYAHMKKDLNQKNLDSQKDVNLMYSIFSDYNQKLAFANPEILSIGKKVLDWVNEDLDIKANLYSLNKLFRMQEHVRTTEVEEVISLLISTTWLLRISCLLKRNWYCQSRQF